MKKIARLQFRRNIKCVALQNSTISLEVIVCSEFNDPITGLLSIINLNVCIISVNGKHFHQLERLKFTKTLKHDILRIKLTIPPLSGYHHIFLSSTNSIDDILVLPLLSDYFLIVDVLSEIDKGTHLGCNRIISMIGNQLDFLDELSTVQLHSFLGDNSIPQYLLIHEEYGLTLGSHLYDSSVVLVRYLQQQERITNLCERQTDCLTIVELGAGCGLVGLWCARSLFAGGDGDSPGRTRVGQVFLTDLSCQEDILRRNISTNCTPSDLMSCSYAELDWTSVLHAQNLMGSIGHCSSDDCGEKPVIDLLIATDVLYDKGAAVLLFDMFRRLGTPGVTRILLAQKLRDNGSSVANKAVDVRTVTGFGKVHVVHEEADVLVWELYVE